MAIVLVYSTSGITSSKNVCRELKMAAVLKILKYQTQLQFDLRYEKIVSNYAKKVFFHGDDIIDDVTRWPQSFHLYACLARLALRASCNGNVSSINANIIIVFLGYTCQKTISMNSTFRDCRSKVNITRAYWVTLALERPWLNVGIIQMKQKLKC